MYTLSPAATESLEEPESETIALAQNPWPDRSLGLAGQPRTALRAGALWHLKPGEIVVTSDARRIVTVLGSCVAVVLYSAHPRVAGMCHAVFPTRPFHCDPERSDLEFADEAIDRMIERFRNQGISPEGIRAKLFGGAQGLGRMQETPFCVGTRNIEEAEECLHRHGVRVVARNVGGREGRKIILDTTTGLVSMWRLGGTGPTRPDCGGSRIHVP